MSNEESKICPHSYFAGQAQGQWAGMYLFTYCQSSYYIWWDDMEVENLSSNCAKLYAVYI